MKKTAVLFLTVLALNAANIEERFPGDYFMIHKNLPHYMQVFRMYGDDPVLGLDATQKQKLSAFQESVVLKVTKAASQIKELELIVQKRVVHEHAKSAELKELIAKIAKQRADLTMEHINCINRVQQVLTPKQHQFFIDKLGIKE